MKCAKHSSFCYGLFSILFILVLFLTSCTQAAPPTPTPTKAPAATTKPATTAATPTAAPSPTVPLKVEKLKVAYTTLGGVMTPPWIAKEAGLFSKYGLDVDLQFVQSGAPAQSALVSGDIDIGCMGGDSIANAVLGGAELTIIGYLNTTTPLRLYTIPSITKGEDLKGKVVAVSKFASSSEYMGKVALKRLGLDPAKDVTIIQAGGVPESLAVLQAGGAQGAMLSPPTSYKAEEAGFKMLVDTLGVEYPSVVLATRKALVTDKEDVMVRFLKAMAEANYTFKTNKELAKKIMGQYTNTQDQKALEDTYNDNKDVHSETLMPTESGMKATLETISPTNAKAATADPKIFIDQHLVKKLEDEGFYKQLYKK